MNKTIRRILILILVIYVVMLIGPIAGLDFPAIGKTIASNPKQLIQYFLIGLANGSIVAIIALGYTMVYGIIELVNFAHGDVFMIGTFTALTTLSLTGTLDTENSVHIILGLALALIAAVAVSAGLNAAIERLAYKRLRNSPRLASLISAIGMSFIVENIGLIWAGQSWLVPRFGTTGGASQKEFPDLVSVLFKNQGWDVNILARFNIGLQFSIKQFLVIVLAVLMMAALRFFVQNTKMGKAMRATAQNRDAAKMMGIDIDWVITLTFLIGGGLAGAAGLMTGLYINTAWWFMGFRAGLQSFTAAVLGGIGNITGAMLGGYLIGMLAAFSDGYLNARWTNAWVFITLVLILLFRPNGLLGEATGQKA